MVFDDAVLHHGHITSTIAMGMGVVHLRLAVRRPAGMADSTKTGRTLLFHPCGEIDELALGSNAVQLGIRIVCRRFNRGDASGVVTAIFQLSQPFKQERCCLSGADHRNDSAHPKKPGNAGLSLWVIELENERGVSTPGPCFEWSHHRDRRGC